MSDQSSNNPSRKKLSMISEIPAKKTRLRKSLARIKLGGTLQQSFVNLKNPKDNFRNNSYEKLSESMKQTNKLKSKILHNLEQSSETIANHRFNICQKTFAKLISNEPRLSFLLTTIKQGYEEFLSKLQRENSKLNHGIDKLQALLGAERSEFERLSRKLNDIELENIHLNTFLDDLDNKLSISSLFSTEEEVENTYEKIQSKILRKLSACLEEIHELKIREGKYDQIFNVLNEKGFPVNDLFDEINLNSHHSLSSEISVDHDSSYILPERYNHTVSYYYQDDFSFTKFKTESFK